MKNEAGSKSMRDLPVKLKPEEIEAMREQLPGEELQLARLKQAAKDSATTHRKGIKDQQAKVTKLAQEIDAGAREEEVECIEVSDFPRGKWVERLDVPEGDPRRVVGEVQAYSADEMEMAQTRDAQTGLFPDEIPGPGAEDEGGPVQPGQKRGMGRKKKDAESATH